MAYYLLKDDLDDSMKSYDENPEITENQRKTWFRKEGQKKTIKQPMLGKYDPDKNPNPLYLLKIDGYNDELVGSLKCRSVESYWNYNTNHVFPPLKDLIFFALFMHYSFYRIVALVLKGMWEYYYGHEKNGWRANVGKDLIDILLGKDNFVMREANNTFNPDTKELFDMFEQHYNLASSAGYTKESFDTLVQEMIRNELHWCSNDSAELDHFSTEEVKRINYLKEGTPNQREEFWRARCEWTQILLQMDEITLSLESQRLKNAEINRKWLRIFGKNYLEMQEEIIRFHNLERRFLLLKASSRGLTRDELEKQVEEHEKKSRKKLEDDETRILIDFIDREFTENSHIISEQELVDYKNECKQILRKIYKLLYPDTIKHNDAYQNLSENQKQELESILHKALEISPEELGYPEGSLHSDIRSKEGLLNVLNKIKFIFKNAGIDVKAEMVIQGDTLKEQLHWLNREIQSLEDAIERSRTLLHGMLEDDEVKQREAMLKVPDQHSQILEDMKKETEQNRQKSNSVEVEINKIFAE